MQKYIKKILGSGRPSYSTSLTTTPIISNDKLKILLKWLKSLENSGL